MTYLIAGVVSFAVALIVTYLLSRISWLMVLDHPNERSLHKVPTPRTGGLAIVIAITGGALVSVPFVRWEPWGIWALGASAVVALISFLDDRVNVAPLARLTVQVVAAGLLILGGVVLLKGVRLPGFWVAWPGWVGVLFTLLFLVWMTNLYNFMDGMDGFAGGMTLVGFGTFAILGFNADQHFFALLNLIVAAAAGGFLVFNFPPARIFMGDVGSSTLGFLAAGFALWAELDRVFPLWIACLVFAPFIIDATVTLLRRLRARQRIWEPHKSHYYQRLVQLGWGHRRTTLAEYVLMGLCAISAVFAQNARVESQWSIIFLWIFVFIVLAIIIGRYEKADEC